jgi:hypothetical protein
MPWVIAQDPADAVHRWNGAAFEKMPGCGTRVSVGSGGDAWILGCKLAGAGGNGVYHWVQDRWMDVPGLTAVAIVKAPGGALWLVDSAGKILEYSTARDGARPTIVPR